MSQTKSEQDRGSDKESGRQTIVRTESQKKSEPDRGPDKEQGRETIVQTESQTDRL